MADMIDVEASQVGEGISSGITSGHHTGSAV